MSSRTTPFKHILHTNTVPTSSQCDEIRSFLHPLRPELSTLDAEIHRLQTLLDAATKERNDLHAFFVAHEALLSPMRRIPNDVLGLIFLHTLPERRNTALDASEGPLLLMRVCRYWRELTLATPRLWASIHLVLSPHASDRLVKCLDDWLARSRAVPLSITVQTPRHLPRIPPPLPVHSESESEANAGEPLRSPLQTVLSASKRWQRVRLAINVAEEALTLSRLTKDDLPLLSTFEITLSAAAEESDHNFNFLATPALRRLAFAGAYHVLPQSIQWQNLTALQLRSYHEDTPCAFPYAFLGHCTALERLAMTISGNHVSASDERVQLPRLTRLSFAFFGGDPNNGQTHALAILERLELPVLHTMDIPFTPASEDLFQMAGYANVRCLIIAGMMLTADELAALLARLPQLSRLRLTGEPIVRDATGNVPDGEFLRKLVVNPPDGDASNHPLCHALEKLELTSTRAVPDSLILAFLISRCTPPNLSLIPQLKPLAAFSCMCYRRAQLDIRNAPEVASAISNGLQLRLIYEPPPSLARYSPLEGTEREPPRPLHEVYRSRLAQSSWLHEFSPDRFFEW
ncbi:F-box domain-containing protein [Mycena chlorophos]|uniref:F-box domain-containing protein n=1 Tax=Mycena chlorophos TaxID=658473 RepID=A0A8H6WJ07_MYCCL|nr:F-box domain-containing protein [Mycena chlorophos]